MAKAYIDIVKYVVEARFDINGLVEKPDIIGAVFGQTEGLLGNSLDLRELQKNGKIGRIEINTSSSGSKTFGKLFLPSSLGRVETCILGAAIESVDRVGPFETAFKVEQINDTRDDKRKKIINRAKELVKNLLNTEIPDSKEISDLVESDVKASIIGTYGVDSLPAGPDVSKDEDVIIVEGRADVVTLLKSDIANCIAIGGASGTVPKTVIDLCGAKEATIFIDGDRGGEMIVKNLIGVADVDFVARAPDGKEVEELTRKEIIKALRSKVPLEQFLQQNRIKDTRQDNHNHGYDKRDQRRPGRFDQRNNRPPFRESEDTNIPSPSTIVNNLRNSTHTESESREREFGSQRTQENGHDERYGKDAGSLGIKSIDGESEPESEDIPSIGQQPTVAPKTNFPNGKYVSSLEELHNTLRGRLYGSDGTLIKEVPIRELIQSIQDSHSAHAVVFDGIITQRLVELSYRQGVKEIYGIRSSQVSRTFPDLGIYTSEKGV